MDRRRTFATSVLGGALLSLALAGPSLAQNRAGDSLVNVQVGDVTVLAPVALAANICDVNVNVLAQQIKDGASCTATAESIAEYNEQARGGGNRAGDTLVNVQIGDITLLLPIAIAANVCDVNVNVLARQLKDGAECEAVADSTAG
jgi:hypothetical protein